MSDGEDSEGGGAEGEHQSHNPHERVKMSELLLRLNGHQQLQADRSGSAPSSSSSSSRPSRGWVAGAEGTTTPQRTSTAAPHGIAATSTSTCSRLFESQLVVSKDESSNRPCFCHDTLESNVERGQLSWDRETKSVLVGHFFFSSAFCSGNGGKIVRVPKPKPLHLGCEPIAGEGSALCYDPWEYHVYVSPDCANTPFQSTCRTWFYFKVRAAEADAQDPTRTHPIHLVIRGMQNQSRLYKENYTVWMRFPDGPWHRIPNLGTSPAPQAGVDHKLGQKTTRIGARSSPADSKTDGIMRGTQQYQLNQQQHCHCEWHPFEQGGSGLALHFQAPIPLDGSSVEFAFCVPFSQADLETYLARLERQFRAYDRTVFTEKTGGNKETPGKKSSAGATSTARETRKVSKPASTSGEQDGGSRPATGAGSGILSSSSKYPKAGPVRGLSAASNPMNWVPPLKAPNPKAAPSRSSSASNSSASLASSSSEAGDAEEVLGTSGRIVVSHEDASRSVLSGRAPGGAGSASSSAEADPATSASSSIEEVAVEAKNSPAGSSSSAEMRSCQPASSSSTSSKLKFSFRTLSGLNDYASLSSPEVSRADGEHLYFFPTRQHHRGMPMPRAGKHVFLRVEKFCKSLQGRNLYLMTITDDRLFRFDPHDPKKLPKLNEALTARPAAFLSARVHPGETPGQFSFLGMVQFLLSDDDRAEALRRAFVFRCIPILNPDGVSLGHYRMNSRGLNLNRFYSKSSAAEHEGVHHTMRFLTETLRKNLFFYLDFHAHATRRGIFLFGNNVTGKSLQLGQDLVAEQAWNVSYSHLCALNSPYFETEGCNFQIKNQMPANSSVVGVGGGGAKVVSSSNPSGGGGGGAARATSAGAGGEPYEQSQTSGASSGAATGGTTTPGSATSAGPPQSSKETIMSREQQNLLGKDGTGRVAVHNLCNVVHSYTLECNYNSINPASSSLKQRWNGGKWDKEFGAVNFFYDVGSWVQVGEALAISLLDMYGHNCRSRLLNLRQNSLSGYLADRHQCLRREMANLTNAHPSQAAAVAASRKQSAAETARERKHSSASGGMGTSGAAASSSGGSAGASPAKGGEKDSSGAGNQSMSGNNKPSALQLDHVGNHLYVCNRLSERERANSGHSSHGTAGSGSAGASSSSSGSSSAGGSSVAGAVTAGGSSASRKLGDYLMYNNQGTVAASEDSTAVPSDAETALGTSSGTDNEKMRFRLEDLVVKAEVPARHLGTMNLADLVKREQTCRENPRCCWRLVNPAGGNSSFGSKKEKIPANAVDFTVYKEHDEVTKVIPPTMQRVWATFGAGGASNSTISCAADDVEEVSATASSSSTRTSESSSSCTTGAGSTTGSKSALIKEPPFVTLQVRQESGSVLGAQGSGGAGGTVVTVIPGNTEPGAPGKSPTKTNSAKASSRESGTAAGKAKAKLKGAVRAISKARSVSNKAGGGGKKKATDAAMKTGTAAATGGGSAN